MRFHITGNGNVTVFSVPFAVAVPRLAPVLDEEFFFQESRRAVFALGWSFLGRGLSERGVAVTAGARPTPGTSGEMCQLSRKQKQGGGRRFWGCRVGARSALAFSRRSWVWPPCPGVSARPSIRPSFRPGSTPVPSRVGSHVPPSPPLAAAAASLRGGAPGPGEAPAGLAPYLRGGGSAQRTRGALASVPSSFFIFFFLFIF